MLTIHSTGNEIGVNFHGCDHFSRVNEPQDLLQFCLFLGFLLILTFRCQKCFLSSHGPICVFGEGFGYSSTQALINGICVPTVVISYNLLLAKLEHCSDKFTLSVVDNGKESEYPSLRVEVPLPASRACSDCNGIKRKAGEEWLVRTEGAYMPISLQSLLIVSFSFSYALTL